MNNILFVSCFVKIYKNINNNERSDEWRINHFKCLLETGINIILFISIEYENNFKYLKLIYPNLIYKIIDIYTELPLFINIPNEPTLPNIRNNSKDTYEYMALMNSKLEFIIKAMKIITKQNYYAWIDFNISYIFKEPDITFSFLTFISKQDLTFNMTENYINEDYSIINKQFLYIPGCWDILDETLLITNNVHWRFCGGFFIGDKYSILNFYEAINNNIQEHLINNSLMVWETNFWAFLESNKKWSPSHWCSVIDHDDSMITKFPTELYITHLKWLNNNIFDVSNIPKIDGFHPSSISYTMNEITNEEFLVCRMINYNLSKNGSYYIFSSSNNNNIININILINLTNKTTKILLNIDTNIVEYTNCFSQGLEDIRIYPDMTFSANSVSLTNGKIPQIIYGKINSIDATITDIKHIKSPRCENECEKNWIFISTIQEIDGREPQSLSPSFTQNIINHSNQTSSIKYIIYRWNPFEIGILNNDEINIIVSLNLTPQYIFKNMRGSTIFTEFYINKPECYYNKKSLIGVIHYSIDQPLNSLIVRKYYHSLILLDYNSLIPIIMTSPFTFNENHGIEFCIGMKYDKITGVFTFWVSIMDESPKEFYIHEDNLIFNIVVSNTINNLLQK